MIALYILLGVLLLLFLILMIRVQVFFTFDGEPTLRIKALFYSKTLIAPDLEHKKKQPKKKPAKKPKKEEKPTETEEKKEEQKQSYLGRIREKKGLSGLISLLTELARIAAGALKGLFSHIVIHRLDVGIALNSGDASSTALTYGKLCAAVYPAVNLIVAATVCRDYHVAIEPVFDSERETAVYADVHAHLRLIFAVWEALKAGAKLLWMRIRL